MADEQLRIVIDALNKASDDITKVKKELGGLDDTTKKVDKSSKSFGQTWAGVLTGINSGIAVAQQVAAALKKIYDTAREGAALEYAESKFDNLSRSIGTTANALEYDLGKATDGMYSKAQLIESAGNFMSLGLAKTHDEVVRLSTVASALNMNMNQLVLTLTNQTTMRFDALGVAVDGFDERLAGLKATGMDANKAFTEAFLQQAEAQIKKVGSAADSAIAPFQKLEAATTDWKNALVQSVTETKIVQTAIEGITDTLVTATRFQDLMTEAVEAGILTEQEMTRIQGDVHKGYQDINEVIDYYNYLLHESPALVDDWAASNYEYITSQEDMNTTVAAAKAPIDDVNLAMKEYNRQLLFAIASEGMTSDEAFAVAEAMGLVEEDTVGAYTAIKDLREEYESGQISLDTYATTANKLADGLDRLHDVDVTVRTTYEEVYNRGFSSGYLPNVRETRAVGGNVMAENDYIWQEYRGGEAFVPSQDGYILSRADAAAALAGGGGKQVVNNYNLTMPTSNSPSDVAMAFEIMRVFGS